MDTCAVGTLIDGRYEVLSLLGQGASGSVYACYSSDFDRQVAVKVLNKTVGNSDSSEKRFFIEAKILANLTHDNIARVYCFGMWQSKPFIVMELLHGAPLSEFVSNISPAQLSDVFLQIIRAVEVAHINGIIHRDIKPANIVVERRKEGLRPKLLDFGIARLKYPDRQRLTSTAGLIGSPFYMSPEQCMGNSIDERSDIYALGCVLFELATGSTLFTGDNMQVMLSHIHDPVSSLPCGLQAVLSKCLAKDPSDRYSDCAELYKDFEVVARTSEWQAGAFRQLVPVLNKSGSQIHRQKNGGVLVAISIILVIGAMLFLRYGNEVLSKHSLPKDREQSRIVDFGLVNEQSLDRYLDLWKHWVDHQLITVQPDMAYQQATDLLSSCKVAMTDRAFVLKTIAAQLSKKNMNVSRLAFQKSIDAFRFAKYYIGEIDSVTELLVADKGRNDPNISADLYLAERVFAAVHRPECLEQGVEKTLLAAKDQALASMYAAENRKDDSQKWFQKSFELLDLASEPDKNRYLQLTNELYENAKRAGVKQSMLSEWLWTSLEHVKSRHGTLTWNGILSSTFTAVATSANTTPQENCLKLMRFLRFLEESAPDIDAHTLMQARLCLALNAQFGMSEAPCCHQLVSKVVPIVLPYFERQMDPVSDKDIDNYLSAVQVSALLKAVEGKATEANSLAEKSLAIAELHQSNPLRKINSLNLMLMVARQMHDYSRALKIGRRELAALQEQGLTLVETTDEKMKYKQNYYAGVLASIEGIKERMQEPAVNERKLKWHIVETCNLQTDFAIDMYIEMAEDCFQRNDQTGARKMTAKARNVCSKLNLSDLDVRLSQIRDLEERIERRSKKVSGGR